jgi:hypothetical protein
VYIVSHNVNGIAASAPAYLHIIVKFDHQSVTVMKNTIGVIVVEVGRPSRTSSISIQHLRSGVWSGTEDKKMDVPS